MAADTFLYLVEYLGNAEEGPALLSGHIQLLYFAELLTQLSFPPHSEIVLVLQNCRARIQKSPARHNPRDSVLCAPEVQHFCFYRVRIPFAEAEAGSACREIQFSRRARPVRPQSLTGVPG